MRRGRGGFAGVGSLAVVGAVVAWAATSAVAGIEQGDLEEGRQVYNQVCVTCHGENGDGKGPAGAALNPPPRDFTQGEFKYGGSDEDIFAVITEGAAVKGGSPSMAAWGAVYSEKQRWGLVKYIRSLKKGETAKKAE